MFSKGTFYALFSCCVTRQTYSHEETVWSHNSYIRAVVTPQLSGTEQSTPSWLERSSYSREKQAPFCAVLPRHTGNWKKVI